MESAIQILMLRLSITRDEAIYIYNGVCDEFNESFTHEETIERANNIINKIFMQ
ncbi:hypothetical protein [Clostridium gasigenes]|uniref:hypothetical protein n=1 Tax=Clostridium gasigenes TaxID=94869 RepID=UPI001C0C9DB2|nr:hypothetical protein [Clostridium gasigenes]MBU3105132.1 hypothetical protein [Clostridium gasigenes]